MSLCAFCRQTPVTSTRQPWLCEPCAARIWAPVPAPAVTKKTKGDRR